MQRGLRQAIASCGGVHSQHVYSVNEGVCARQGHEDLISDHVLQTIPDKIEQSVACLWQNWLHFSLMESIDEAKLCCWWFTDLALRVSAS